MKWYIGPIEQHLADIKRLFAKTADHKHADNYSKWPLFQYTVFSRMAWDNDELVYYSAGIERPEYNGSIRIMSRHVRDRDYDFGGWKADLARGLETLDASVAEAERLGFAAIWVSREDNPKLLAYFAEHSKYNWKIVHEELPGGVGKQWVLRKTYY